MATHGDLQRRYRGQRMYPLVFCGHRNTWFTHEFHGGFPWFTMVMLVYQRASVHCRDGHKVGRLLLSKHTKNIHRTPVDSIYQDLLSSSKKNIIKHHQTRHHVDWHNPTKKGDQSSYQITPQKKSRYSHSNHDYSVHWDIQTCSEGWGSAATCNQRVRSELEPPESWTKPRLIVFFI